MGRSTGNTLCIVFYFIFYFYFTVFVLIGLAPWPLRQHLNSSVKTDFFIENSRQKYIFLSHFPQCLYISNFMLSKLQTCCLFYWLHSIRLAYLFFVFFLTLVQNGLHPYGWKSLMSSCMMTIIWTTRTSGLSILTTVRQTQSPRRRGKEAGRFIATVPMEGMCLVFICQFINFLKIEPSWGSSHWEY